MGAKIRTPSCARRLRDKQCEKHRRASRQRRFCNGLARRRGGRFGGGGDPRSYPRGNAICTRNTLSAVNKAVNPRRRSISTALGSSCPAGTRAKSRRPRQAGAVSEVSIPFLLFFFFAPIGFAKRSPGPTRNNYHKPTRETRPS